NCEFSINEISTQQNQIQKMDICSFSKTKSKTNHENNLLSEQAPPLYREINSENNEFVNQNCDNHSLQLISNDLYSSNRNLEYSQDVTRNLNYINPDYLNYNPYLSPFLYILPYLYSYL
ncbi:28697_t:CDS:2, partial [Gigaspora margarita]